MRIHLLAIAAFSTLVSGLLLSGCSTNFAPGPETPVQTAFGPVGGQVYGGQAPITGAQIYAYQTSTSAYGGASKSLISATGGVTGFPPTEDGKGNYYVATDASGAFEISSATTCTSGTVVYLYSLGGNAGGGANTNASEMAVLGTCPASGLLINALTAGTSVRIYMNEVSTVAAAYALAGFATDATDIGAPTTTGGVVTDTLAQTGIQNAGANAAQIYTAVATSLTTPGSSRTANATTPNGNGTVPQSTVDTIANILASCINSAKPFTNCNTLFSDDASGGGTSGTKATETSTAAIYLAQHPYSTKVTALFNLVSSTGHVFSPDLGTATPSDFTVTLSFTGGGLALTGGESPHDVAIDVDGNVWSLTSGSVLCEFSPLGVPATSTGYTGNGLDGTASLAIDADSQYIYITNYYTDSVSRFTTAGAAASSFNIGATGQQDANIDGSGNIWITADTPSELIKLSPTGTVLETETGEGLKTPYGTAIEPGAAGNVWVANSAANQISVFTNSGTGYTEVTSHAREAIGAAVDSSGNVWLGETNGNIGAYTSTGTAISTGYASGGNFADGVAIDGGDNIWVSGYTSGEVHEFSDAGTQLSETAGFTISPTTDPDGIAVDGSGNVWYDSYTDSTLREIVGASVPVVTPLAYAVANSLLGARP